MLCGRWTDNKVAPADVYLLRKKRGKLLFKDFCKRRALPGRLRQHPVCPCERIEPTDEGVAGFFGQKSLAQSLVSNRADHREKIGRAMLQLSDQELLLLLLRMFALANVNDRCQNGCLAIAANWREPNFDGNIGTILPAAAEITTSTHRSRCRLLEVVLALRFMSFGQRRRNQTIHAPANQLCSRISE